MLGKILDPFLPVCLQHGSHDVAQPVPHDTSKVFP
jgi:hypothetical protein